MLTGSCEALHLAHVGCNTVAKPEYTGTHRNRGTGTVRVPRTLASKVASTAPCRVRALGAKTLLFRGFTAWGSLSAH